MQVDGQGWHPRLIEDFGRDGFVVVDRALDASALGEFARGYAMLGRFADRGERYDAAAQMPQFQRLAACRMLQYVANALLDRHPDAPLYGFTQRCRIDGPGDERRTYGWHQEVFYTIPGSRFVQTWAPLGRDVDEAGGTIEVCVGSHRAGVAPQRWTEPEGRARQILVDEAEVAKYEQRALPMTLGQVLFFDPHLFHRSGRNRSDADRLTLVGMLHDVDATGFRAPVPRFDYRGASPREAYERFAAGEGGTS